MKILELTNEEIVSHILGLPIDRVKFLMEEHHMPIEDEAFSQWFIENAALVLEEKRQHFKKVMGVPDEATSEVFPAVLSHAVDGS